MKTAELLKYIKPIFPDKPPQIMKNADSYYKNLQEMLHARMLLSCLCDADYTATASHYDNSVISKSEEHTINAKAILESLLKYKEIFLRNPKQMPNLTKYAIVYLKTV